VTPISIFYISSSLSSQLRTTVTLTFDFCLNNTCLFLSLLQCGFSLLLLNQFFYVYVMLVSEW